jgi:hypothetical protein
MPRDLDRKRGPLVRSAARPFGRWQASYIAPDGLRRYTGGTFDRKATPSGGCPWVESEILRGEWLDPLLSAVSVEGYARA